jgi:hypothetical protein
MKMITAVVATAFLASASIAAAAQPTQADFDACNRSAQSNVSSPSASPQIQSKTDAQTHSSASGPQAAPSPESAGQARGQSDPKSHTSAAGPQAAPSPEPAGEARVSNQADPLRGIADASKDDKAYQQAYRDCMKTRGF